MGFGLGPEEGCVGICLEQEGVASFSLLHDANSWHIVNLPLFASFWESGELSFRKIKVLLTTSFQRTPFSQHVKREISLSLGQSCV